MIDLDEWAKPVAVSATAALVSFVLSLPIACSVIGSDFARSSPHDGQDALGTITFALLTSFVVGTLAFGTTLAVYIVRAVNASREDET